jgi:transposase
MEFEIYDSAHLPVIAHFCDRLKIKNIADESLPWDRSQWEISPGTVIKGIIIDALSGRSPLYRMNEFFETTDIKHLLGQGVEASHFNDDRLGRTLDIIYKHGATRLFGDIVISAINEFHLDLKMIHADTTSKSVYGDYKHQNPNSIDITYGFSKDKRPDLKQLLFGVVTTQDKVPIYANVTHGNTDDKTWNNNLLNIIQKKLVGVDLSKVTYVADSAVVTKENLTTIAGLPLNLISRFPETFSLCHDLIERAVRDNVWEDIGKLSTRTGSASYKINSYIEELYGLKYRFVVVYSDKHNERKLKSLSKKIKKEHTRLLKLNEKPALFHCEKDAHDALLSTIKSTTFWNVTGQVQVVKIMKKRNKRGRRPKNAVVEYDTFYKVQYKITENDSKIKCEQQKAGMFVLITSDHNELCDKRILVEYKGQISVEQTFKFLKSPMIVDRLFLKNNSRIEALGYLMLIALMVWTLMEREVRQNISEPLIGPGKIKMIKPTAWAIMMMLSSLKIIVYNNNNHFSRNFANPPTENQLKCLALLGMPPEKYLVLF